MARLLEGKTCAITGSVTGIGRAIALDFLRHGANVAVNHLDDARSRAQFASMQADTSFSDALISVPGDIAQDDTAADLVAQTVQRFGQLDVLVSNAGVCEFAEFLDVTPSLLDTTLNTNLRGAYLATQAAARQMVSQGTGGSLIGISSISALVGGARQTHYTPTKAGILSLMQSAACALGEHGIRANALLPGTIATQLNEADLAEPGKGEYMRSRIPLGRIGVPGDLAGPAVFLASDLSAYVTGAQLLVDGGLFVNLQ